MAQITVKQRDASTFEVQVQDRSATQHVVTVTPEVATRLTGEHVPLDQLVRASFEFLLEREPNTSILRSFDLMVIARYFPEYEREIKNLLK